MKSFLMYLAIAVVVIGALTYALGEQGLLGGILGALGLGGSKAIDKFKKKAKELEQKAEAVEKEIAAIDEKQKNLKVDDLTPEEEAEYWKNQGE